MNLDELRPIYWDAYYAEYKPGREKENHDFAILSLAQAVWKDTRDKERAHVVEACYRAVNAHPEVEMGEPESEAGRIIRQRFPGIIPEPKNCR